MSAERLEAFGESTVPKEEEDGDTTELTDLFVLQGIKCVDSWYEWKKS
jgi:hypothetical protein